MIMAEYLRDLFLSLAWKSIQGRGSWKWWKIMQYKYIVAGSGCAAPIIVMVGFGLGLYRLSGIHFMVLAVIGIIGYFGVMAISLQCDMRDVIRRKNELGNLRQAIWSIGLLVWLLLLLLVFVVCYMGYHKIGD